MTGAAKARFRTPAIWMLAGLVGSALGVALTPAVSYMHRQYQGPIIEHLGADEPRYANVPQAGFLRVVVHYRKATDCPGTWAYFARWHGDAAWHQLASGAAGSNPVGRYAVSHAVQIPPDAPLGVAVWREVVQMRCDDGHETISRSPDVHFIVRPAGD